MKMAYERPMMMAEAYAANSYVAACETMTLTDKIVSFVKGNWYEALGYNQSHRGDDRLNSNEITRNNLGEYYDEMLAATQTEITFGGTALQTTNNNGTHTYWESTVPNSPLYYLEYSSNWTSTRREDTYFLYLEYNGNKGLQSNNEAQSWPTAEPKKDLCLAGVTYMYGTSIVGS